MKNPDLLARVRALATEHLPLYGEGNTATRLFRLFEIGYEDLSLAKLLEAHWDAVAILQEAGYAPEPDVIYSVWASEIPDRPIIIEKQTTVDKDNFVLTGEKPFCSGLGLVDHALITAVGPEPLLIDLNLRKLTSEQFSINTDTWKTPAFSGTQTGSLTLNKASFSKKNIIGGPGWYLTRVGFWQGALGPAACWAGGAAALADYALANKRADNHTLAHVGAMEADVWAMRALLQMAAEEIDAKPQQCAQRLALQVRHLIEQHCTDILQRLGRALGPYPLAVDAHISKQAQELTLYLRQCHAERDLASLGALLRQSASES